jgi:aminopeptidase N
MLNLISKTPQIIKWLEKRVGVEFPFPRYYQIITPKAGGAMENISLVTWDYCCKYDYEKY